MGTTFVIVTGLKLCAMGGLGIALTTAIQYFNSFEFKPKKKGGDSDATNVGDVLREKSRSIS